MAATAEEKQRAKYAKIWDNQIEAGKSWAQAAVEVDRVRYINELTGWRIDGAGIDNSDPDVSIPYLIVSKRGKKKIVFISQDQEFNGPGHLEIDGDALQS